MKTLISIGLAICSVATAHAQTTMTMDDSVAAMSTAGRYIINRYGGDLLLNPDIRCASVRQCRVEHASPAVASSASTRRKLLLEELRRQLHNPRLVTREAALGCDDQTRTCRVRGAARFFEINEPTFNGSTATVRIHYYENDGRFVRQQSDLLHLSRGAAADWVIVGRDAYGMHAK